MNKICNNLGKEKKKVIKDILFRISGYEKAWKTVFCLKMKWKNRYFKILRKCTNKVYHNFEKGNNKNNKRHPPQNY